MRSARQARRFSSAIALGLFAAPVGLGGLLGACAPSATEPVALRFAPTTLHGQTLVGRLENIQLDVFAEESGVRCTEAGGAEGLEAEPAPTVLTSAELSTSNCPPGARFCGQVELDRATTPRIFVARGLDASGEVFAQACTSVALDRAQVDVDLVFQRVLPPATCGNGTLEAPETCETPGKGSCDARCTSQAELVSTGAAANTTVDGQGAAKTEPVLVATSSAIIALYSDATTASDDGDVALRVLAPTLGPVSTPTPLAASFFLPTGAPPGATAAGLQGGVAACATGSVLLVAYETAGVGIDVALRALDLTSYAGAAEQLITGDATGTAGDQRFAEIACSDTAAFVTWRDVASGRVLGRRVGLPATLGRIQELGGASDGTHVSVARRSTGWIVAWDAGRQIRYRVLGEDGTPSGGEVALDGDAVRTSPRLADLPDGRVGLVYAEGEEAARIVRLQRFDAEGRRLGEAAVLSVAGAQDPALTALPTAVGGAYGVVWTLGDRVQARLVGGDAGFLLNPITSTEDAFFVDGTGRTPKSPTATVTADAWAVGWHDDAADGGIIARLLPLPAR